MTQPPLDVRRARRSQIGRGEKETADSRLPVLPATAAGTRAADDPASAENLARRARQLEQAG